MQAVGFVGSRSLSSALAGELVERAVGAAVAAGAEVFVGCSAGADGLALAAALAAGARLRVFAVGASSGAGFWPGSVLPLVRRAARSGALVSWLAGGSLRVPLRGRLVRRSAALVASLPPGSPLVGFLASPSSVGSLRALSAAAARGLPVLAVPVGFPPSALPSLGAGSWAPAPEVMSSLPPALAAGAWAWRPSEQLALF